MQFRVKVCKRCLIYSTRLMKEDAFYDRLREGFNDIFLTVGFDGDAESALSYEHFSKTRHWTQKYDLSHIGDEESAAEGALQAGRRLSRGAARRADEARSSTSCATISRSRRSSRPITSWSRPTRRAAMASLTSCKRQFKNPDDPFEYIPVKLKALKGRSKSDDQESATGFYPHAGMLSTFQYLRRYPDDGNEPQSPAVADVLSAFPGH